MGTKSKKNVNLTIEETMKRTLTGVFTLILGVVVLIAVSLFLFTRYTAVVNSAGIVRGGSQRVIKQVIAGADESTALGLVDTTLTQIGEQMHLGNFPKSRDEVEVYWNNTIKPDIDEFKASGDFSVLLEDSETLFKMTNQMVSDAQTLVDILAIALYVILAVFLIVCFFTIKKVIAIFNSSVVKPIGELEGSLNNLADGILSEEFVYEKKDEIGRLLMNPKEIAQDLCWKAWDILEPIKNANQVNELIEEALKYDKNCCDAYVLKSLICLNDTEKMKNLDLAIEVYEKSHDTNFFKNHIGSFHGPEFNPYIRALYYKSELLLKLKKQKEAKYFISLLLDLDKNDHIGARCLL